MKSDFEKSIPQLEKLRSKHERRLEKLAAMTWTQAGRREVEKCASRIAEITSVIRSKKDQAPLF